MEKALEIAFSKQQERIEYVKKLNHKIVDKLKEYPQVLLNHTECSLPHVINISLKGIKATKFAELLDHQGVCISTKTSCCPVETPSKMIYALYHDRGRALSSFRISLSHLTTEKEIDEFLAIFLNVIRSVLKMEKYREIERSIIKLIVKKFGLNLLKLLKTINLFKKMIKSWFVSVGVKILF